MLLFIGLMMGIMIGATGMYFMTNRRAASIQNTEPIHVTVSAGKHASSQPHIQPVHRHLGFEPQEVINKVKASGRKSVSTRRLAGQLGCPHPPGLKAYWWVRRQLENAGANQADNGRPSRLKLINVTS